MADTTPNPYAPPTRSVDSASPTPPLQTLSESGPIAFGGNVTSEDLMSYLRAHDHIGCASMLMTALGLGLILLVFATVAGGAIGLITLGIMGWLLLTLITSLVPYRRSVFISSNPKWNASIEGRISTDGIWLDREDTESTFRWDWFGGTIISDRVVAFLPALHPHQPLLFTPAMMSRLDDWDRVVGIAKTLGAAIDPMSTRESRKYDNRRIIRSRNRSRSLAVPDDALPFEGMVSMSDLRHLPPVMLRRNRPTRAYALIMGLAIFAGFVLIGAIRIGRFNPVFPTFSIVLVALTVLLLLLVRRIRSLRAPGDTIYYLTAFADEKGVTSDFGVTTTFVPWNAMRLSEMSDEAVALSRLQVRQFIVARADMFADTDRWQQFQQLVRKKLT